MDMKVQDDWTNREFIELIAANVKRIADFLNKFGTFVFVLHSTLLVCGMLPFPFLPLSCALSPMYRTIRVWGIYRI